MPGLSLIRADGEIDDHALDRGLDDVCFFDGYTCRELHRTADTALVATGYEEYPVHVVETDDAVVALEGHLYGIRNRDEALRTVSSWVTSGRTDRLAAWLDERDGDFLLVVIDRASGEIHLANDALGRLPTYRASRDGTTVVSREIAFVRTVLANQGRESALDPLGVAQTLLFGYQLGTRTLFDGIERLPPGTIGHVDQRGDAEVNQVNGFDFERKTHRRRSRQTNASRLKALFLDACHNRAGVGGPNVVALSGGFDSRTVAAGYRHAGIPFTAATYQLDGQQTADVRLAAEVADALDVEWTRYDVTGGPQHRATLLAIKQGLNYLYVDFLLDFLEQLRDTHGPLTLVTGDGGDKALPDLTPGRPLGTFDDLIEYTLAQNAVFSAADAAAIAGVERHRLLESVRDRFRGYPEVAHEAAYVHFLVRERGINWLNEGEDRNRYFGWSVSPFYSVPFFRYAMNCPDEQKRANRLYHEFLGKLSSDLLDVEYADFGAAPTSIEYRVKRLGYESLRRYPRVQAAIVRLFRGREDDHPELTRRIRDRVAGGEVSGLAGEPVRAVLRSNRDEAALSHLDTVTAVADRDWPTELPRTTGTGTREQSNAAGGTVDS